MTSYLSYPCQNGSFTIVKIITVKIDEGHKGHSYPLSKVSGPVARSCILVSLNHHTVHTMNVHAANPYSLIS